MSDTIGAALDRQEAEITAYYHERTRGRRLGALRLLAYALIGTLLVVFLAFLGQDLWAAFALSVLVLAATLIELRFQSHQKPRPVTGVRALYARLAAAYEAEPITPKRGCGAPGDRYPL